jgi:hypothetical protein
MLNEGYSVDIFGDRFVTCDIHKKAKYAYQEWPHPEDTALHTAKIISREEREHIL